MRHVGLIILAKDAIALILSSRKNWLIEESVIRVNYAL